MSNNNYTDRIDKVINYIENNLSEKITLDSMAEISHFSKYHFSRIFTSIVGVTPLAYLTRERLKKSVSLLVNSNESILEISTLCGFESISNFNVAFKKQFNKTPSKVRRDAADNSYIFTKLSYKQKEIGNLPRYDESVDRNFLRRIWQMNISIKELPDYEVAFVRQVGSYLDTSKAWESLGAWAGRNGCLPPEQNFIGISLDDPNSTEEYECRYDACVTIPQAFEKENHSDVQFRVLPGGLYGCYRFYDTIDKLAIAYQSIFGQWLPDSEYDPDERHCLEFCMNNPFEDPEGKAKVDLYVPIKPRASEIL